MTHLATLKHGLPGTATLVRLGELMALKPIGNRILIQPDEQPAATDSGLVLPTDRHHIPTSGIVVAVGDGPARDARIREATIARCMAIVVELSYGLHVDADETVNDIVTELRRYKNQAEKFDSLHVGDRVVYPVESGLAITEDGQQYILLNEDDAVVVATEEETAA
jgi:co-chaperonin GroES (HSP10)